MTGYTVHTGANEKFVEGWDRIFSDGKKKKPGSKKSAGKKTAQASAKKSTAKKSKSGKAAKK